jgi:Lipid A 3-O-deacylase (PagL)
VVRTILGTIAIVTLLFAPAARAQSGSSASAGAGVDASANPDAASDAGPAKGGHDFEIWTGGGPSGNGGIPDLGVWNAGLRYGWVLTGPRGPLFLRGRFEYAVDAEPIFWVFQPGGTAYGLVLVPMALKWDFVTRARMVPYLDIDGGVLLTNRDTPPGISRINFTPSMAAGVHFLRHKYNWSAELRFLHASDASLTQLNPGINTIEVRLSVGLFTHSK